MKRLKQILLLIFIAVLWLGCDKKEDEPEVKPITLYDKLTGTWYPESLMQTDELAKSSGNELYEVDLVDLFGFSDIEISFNLNEEKDPTTFEVTGAAPELFLKQGYWDLDNPFPTTDGSLNIIRLYADDTRSEILDQLELITLPGASNDLVFRLSRTSAGVRYVSYDFSMKPVN